MRGEIHKVRILLGITGSGGPACGNLFVLVEDPLSAVQQFSRQFEENKLNAIRTDIETKIEL